MLAEVEMQNQIDIIIISELGVDYVSPEDHVVEKPTQNGSVNGKDIKQLIDPYDELIKNHLRKEEKIKVHVPVKCNHSLVQSFIKIIK